MEIEIVEIERDSEEIGEMNMIGLEIDGKSRIWEERRVVNKIVKILLGEIDRKDEVIEEIIVENIGKWGRDKEEDEVVEKRKWRMLERREEKEIVEGEENMRIEVEGIVKKEIRVLRKVLIEENLGEKEIEKKGEIDSIKVIIRNDNVSVDIENRKGGREESEIGEIINVMKM